MWGRLFLDVFIESGSVVALVLGGIVGAAVVSAVMASDR